MKDKFVLSFGFALKIFTNGMNSFVPAMNQSDNCTPTGGKGALHGQPFAE